MTLKIVLDTNVCLDLFAFKDPRWAKIMQGLIEKTLIATTRSDCRDEWLAVLHYPHLPITNENRTDIEAAFDQLIEVTLNTISDKKLPICSDKDDQKFLEHARDENARFLITKDKALLKLSRKVQNLNLFIIETPEKFVARLVANPQDM
jgi:putative PIN family toxin of toxin-antitoxin system